MNLRFQYAINSAKLSSIKFCLKPLLSMVIVEIETNRHIAINRF